MYVGQDLLDRSSEALKQEQSLCEIMPQANRGLGVRRHLSRKPLSDERVPLRGTTISRPPRTPFRKSECLRMHVLPPSKRLSIVM